MITFQDKVAINENPDIPEVNKITDDNINELKAGINTNETNITNSTTYSTNEIVIGKWINNKPLYRKVYTGDLGEDTIAHGLTNFKIARIYGNYYNSSPGNWFPIPSTRPTNPDYGLGVYVNSTNINFERGSGVQSSSMLVEIVLEYTKTTD